MEGQSGEAYPPLSAALDPQVAGDEAQPSQHNSENRDEVAAEGGTLPLRMSRAKQAVTSKAVLFAFVVILLSGARYIMSRKSRSYLASQLPLDDASMQKYLVNFNNSVDKMEKVLDETEPDVLQAFHKHYTPSLENGKQFLDDPLAIISSHVAKMQECQVPPGSSVKDRRAFAQHLHFLEAICRTVALRLVELRSLSDVALAFNAPLPALGIYKRPSDTNTETHQTLDEYNVKLEVFLNTVGLVVGEKQNNTVVGKLAYKLMGLLDIEKTHLSSNIMARCYFERFLPSFEEDNAFHSALSTSEYRLPYDRKQLRIGALAQAAAPIFREADSTPHYANVVKLHRIVENWTDEGVRWHAKKQEEENNKYFQNRLNIKREQMRALLKKGIPSDDLVMSALFLL